MIVVVIKGIQCSSTRGPISVSSGIIVKPALTFHNEGLIEPDLKELVRLKIARLNDCFT